ncbi:MAG: hypothetical protein AB6733_12355 [Clostridiaceae bacterium]
MNNVEDFIRKLVQQELKKIKKISNALIILIIVFLISNVISSYQYNQLIKKEKLFLEHGYKILADIENK